MTLGTGAAVNVDTRVVEAEVVHGHHGDHGESLVDLVQIDVAGVPARALQHFANSADRRNGELRGRLAVPRVRDNPRPGLEAALLHFTPRHEYQGTRAV